MATKLLPMQKRADAFEIGDRCLFKDGVTRHVSKVVKRGDDVSLHFGSLIVITPGFALLDTAPPEPVPTQRKPRARKAPAPAAVFVAPA